MENFFEKNKQLVVVSVLLLILGSLLVLTQSKKNNDFMGKTYYNDGNTGAVYTNATEATLVLEGNTGRKLMEYTVEDCPEGIHLFKRSFTGTTTATAGTQRAGGVFLVTNGSYTHPDGNLPDSYLWVGDVWASTSSTPCKINYSEK